MRSSATGFSPVSRWGRCRTSRPRAPARKRGRHRRAILADRCITSCAATAARSIPNRGWRVSRIGTTSEAGNRRWVMKQVGLIAAATGAVFLITIGHGAGQTAGAAEKNTAGTYKQLNLFGDVLEIVRSNYAEDVKDDTLVEGAINGMLTALDPHSNFLNAKNFTDMKVQTRGEFGGLGIEVSMENGLVKVVSPIDDTPAASAGLKPGD